MPTIYKFCERCGKRVSTDPDSVHTCTPHPFSEWQKHQLRCLIDTLEESRERMRVLAPAWLGPIAVSKGDLLGSNRVGYAAIVATMEILEEILNEEPDA